MHLNNGVEVIPYVIVFKTEIQLTFQLGILNIKNYLIW